MKKKLLIILGILIIGIGSVTGYVLLKPKPEPELVLLDNVIYEFGQSNLESKYDLDIINVEDFVDANDEASIFDEISFQEIIIADKKDEVEDVQEPASKEIDTTKLGVDFKATIYARLGEVVKEFEVSYTVQDTQVPEITGKDKYTITEGQSLALKDSIKATDPVDGDVTVTFDKDDFSKPGTYEVTATAKDSNDNETTKAITVVVDKKPVAVVKPPTVKPPVNSGGNTSKPPANNGGGNSSGGSEVVHPPENNQDYMDATGAGEVVAEGITYRGRDKDYKDMFYLTSSDPTVGRFTYRRKGPGDGGGFFSWDAQNLTDEQCWAIMAWAKDR